MLVELCRMKWLLLLLLRALDVFCFSDNDDDTCTRVCGSRPIAISHGNFLRIVGGTDTLPGTWPWAVSFQFPTRKGWRHFCAGSLINSRWVISTARCFIIQKYLKVEYFRVQIGATQRSKPGPDSQNRVIKRLVDHTKFDPDYHLNNIALIELDKPVICNDYVQPACLPEEHLNIDTLTHCFICGWGITNIKNGAKYSDILQEAQVSLMDRAACNSSIQYSMRIKEEHICAISEEATMDSCRGDGGGPLMCRTAHSERFWLVGLNSWGTGCSNGKVPGVFTSTQSFLRWIRSTMENPPMSALAPPFRPTPPTTPSTPTPPPPSRYTGYYYYNPIYKKVNGVLVGYFPEAKTRYTLRTVYWRPPSKRTTWSWNMGPKRTFTPFSFPPITAAWPARTTAFLGWGKGPSVIYRLPRRKLTTSLQTRYTQWPGSYYWNRPHL